MRLPDGEMETLRHCGGSICLPSRSMQTIDRPLSFLFTGAREAGVFQSVAEPKTVRDLWVHKQDEWMGPTSSAERLPTAEYAINDTFRTMRIGRHPLI